MKEDWLTREDLILTKNEIIPIGPHFLTLSAG